MKKFLRKRFLLFMTAFLAVMFLVLYLCLTHLAIHETDRLFEREFAEIRDTFQSDLRSLELEQKALKETLLQKVRIFAKELAADPKKVKNHDWLVQTGRALEANSLCISDSKGVLIAATDEGFIGFHMDSTEQSKAFMPACTDPTFELCQDPMSRGIDNIAVQYAGVARIDEPGIVQVGKEYPDGLFDPVLMLQNIMQEHPVAELGCLAVIEQADWKPETRVIASTNPGINGKEMEYIGMQRSFLKNAMSIADVPYYYTEVASIVIAGKEYPIVACIALDEMFRGRNQVLLICFVSLITMMFILYLLLIRFLQKNIIDAIYRMNKVMEQVIAGNLRVTVSEKHLPEFAALTDAVNTTVGELQRRNRKSTKLMHGEREITQSILNTVNNLQEPFYPGVPNLDFYACFEQTGNLCADCVQLLTYRDGSPLFILSDSVGAGPAACLYMMKFRATLQNCMDGGVIPPLPELMRRLRAAMVAEPGLSKLFLSAFFGHYIPETRTLEYVNAGYIAPMLKRAGADSVERIGEGFKCLLSSKPDAKDRLQSVQLNPGDLLLAFSAGLTLSANASKELFSTLKIEEILKTLPADSARSTVDAMVEEYRKFMSSKTPENDILLLALRAR